jgi:hypothetical protein
VSDHDSAVCGSPASPIPASESPQAGSPREVDAGGVDLAVYNAGPGASFPVESILPGRWPDISRSHAVSVAARSAQVPGTAAVPRRCAELNSEQHKNRRFRLRTSTIASPCCALSRKIRVDRAEALPDDNPDPKKHQEDDGEGLPSFPT